MNTINGRIARSVFVFCGAWLLVACPPGTRVTSTGFRVTSVSVALRRSGGLNADVNVTIERTSARPEDTLSVPIELLESDGGFRFKDDLLDKGAAIIGPNNTTGVRRFVLTCAPDLTLSGDLDGTGEGGPGYLGFGCDNAELYGRAGGNSSSQLRVAPCCPP